MDVRATLTTRWDKGYKSVGLERVVDFDIDSAMDTDTDTWSLTLGDASIGGDSDRNLDMTRLLRRDNEVRVDLVIVDEGKLTALHRGFADEIGLNHEQFIQINGRDITAVAADTTATPVMHRNFRGHKLIAKEARQLKIGGNLKLLEHRPVKKFFTDGSETYWEKWYRFYRKFCKAWMWAEPDGTIVADRLNYQDKATYFFGEPRKVRGKSHDWINVERLEWRKSTTSRIWEVIVFGHRGDQPIGPVRARDPSIKNWIKRPRRIITDADVRNEKQAKHLAFEEIFEGKVGALEIRLVCEHPGHPIRQNRMAFVNFPSIGLAGTFFVVGCRTTGGPDGLFMEVRLREKGYAISKRVPDDPQLRSPDHEPADGTDVMLSGALPDTIGGKKVNWKDCFVTAAKQFHGQFGFQLFLAALFAICDIESDFRNIRHYSPDQDVPEHNWYPEPSDPSKKNKWARDLANEARYGRVSDDCAVGPMGLYTRDYKLWADDRARKIQPGGGWQGHDELRGGRWLPCANIWAGARAFAGKASGLPGSKQDMQRALVRYNGAGASAEAYGREAMRLIDQVYLPAVQAAQRTASRPSPDAPRGDPSTPGGQNVYVERVIAMARAQLGDPYVWGAIGPNSFDCSGLIYYIWGHVTGLGVGRLGGRTTYNMWAGGRGAGVLVRVKRAHLLPGDLVFFFMNSSGPGHMGMHWGDNKFIQAPRTGDVVKISTYSGSYSSGFVGALRDPKLWPAAAG